MQPRGEEAELGVGSRESESEGRIAKKREKKELRPLMLQQQIYLVTEDTWVQ